MIRIIASMCLQALPVWVAPSPSPRRWSPLIPLSFTCLRPGTAALGGCGACWATWPAQHRRWGCDTAGCWGCVVAGQLWSGFCSYGVWDEGTSAEGPTGIACYVIPIQSTTMASPSPPAWCHRMIRYTVYTPQLTHPHITSHACCPALSCAPSPASSLPQPHKRAGLVLCQQLEVALRQAAVPDCDSQMVEAAAR